MYAIVEINGQQFQAEAGRRLYVQRIQNAEKDATMEFDRVLLVDKDGAITVGTPLVDGAKVVCKIVTPMVKGDKVIIFHKKRRKGYRKRNGHRQQFTELTITKVVIA
jgi:large subunit ribosomal protein L21